MKTVILPLKGYEGIYDISNHGRIRKLSNGFFVRPRMVGKAGRKKIPTVDLTNAEGRRLQLSLPRLVAQHFVKNPDEWICIYQKDGNLQNCNAWNIIWIPNDVVNWLGTQKKGKQKHKGMPKYLGTKNEAIEFMSQIRQGKEGENFLLEFYRSGNEQFLWKIFDLFSQKIKTKILTLVKEEEAHHDLLIDSFLYFIDLAKRYAIYTYTYKKWLDCLNLEVKKYYRQQYKHVNFNGEYNYETDDI